MFKKVLFLIMVAGVTSGICAFPYEAAILMVDTVKLLQAALAEPSKYASTCDDKFFSVEGQKKLDFLLDHMSLSESYRAEADKIRNMLFHVSWNTGKLAEGKREEDIDLIGEIKQYLINTEKDPEKLKKKLEILPKFQCYQMSHLEFSQAIDSI